MHAPPLFIAVRGQEEMAQVPALGPMKYSQLGKKLFCGTYTCRSV